MDEFRRPAQGARDNLVSENALLGALYERKNSNIENKIHLPDFKQVSEKPEPIKHTG